MLPSEPSTIPAERRDPIWRRASRRVLLVAAGVVAALLLAEVLLRVWTALANPPIYELDPVLGWRHVAGVDRRLDNGAGRAVRFATDARGLRATPHPTARAAGTRRVLVVGDSFTQGSQVEADELFTSGLERALDGVEVWNAGVGGYSTLQELRALEPQLRDYRPDLVVLAVFENDFQDNLMPYYSGLGPRPHVRVQGDRVELVDRPDPARFERFLLPWPGALWWYEHSALYRALHKNVFVPQQAFAIAELEAAERGALPEADQWRAMSWLLGQFAVAVQTAGAALLVAAIPDREAVRAGRAPSHDWLAVELRSLGVPFVSLLAPLRAIGAERAYFADDIHLTVAGHAAVVQALREPVAAALRQGG